VLNIVICIQTIAAAAAAAAAASATQLAAAGMVTNFLQVQ
jgi:hypothetical protein